MLSISLCLISDSLCLTHSSVSVVSQRCAGGGRGDWGGEGAACGGLCCHQEGLHHLSPWGWSRRAPSGRRWRSRPDRRQEPGGRRDERHHHHHAAHLAPHAAALREPQQRPPGHQSVASPLIDTLTFPDLWSEFQSSSHLLIQKWNRVENRHHLQNFLMQLFPYLGCLGLVSLWGVCWCLVMASPHQPRQKTSFLHWFC